VNFTLITGLISGCQNSELRGTDMRERERERKGERRSYRRLEKADSCDHSYLYTTPVGIVRSDGTHRSDGEWMQTATTRSEGN
jgi:hypothetical protein